MSDHKQRRSVDDEPQVDRSGRGRRKAASVVLDDKTMLLKGDLKYAERNRDLYRRILESTAEAVLPERGFIKAEGGWRRPTDSPNLSISAPFALAELFDPEAIL